MLLRHATGATGTGAPLTGNGGRRPRGLPCETDDPIAGRMPRGIDSREDEERDFAGKFTPAGAARAEENVVWGTSDDTAVAEVVITEISPFDVDTQTTFMCEYHFKSDEEKELANEAEVERCFARGRTTLLKKGGGVSRGCNVQCQNWKAHFRRLRLRVHSGRLQTRRQVARRRRTSRVGSPRTPNHHAEADLPESK